MYIYYFHSVTSTHYTPYPTNHTRTPPQTYHNSEQESPKEIEKNPKRTPLPASFLPFLFCMQSKESRARQKIRPKKIPTRLLLPLSGEITQSKFISRSAAFFRRYGVS